MENRDRMIYWGATGLLAAFMLANVGLYLFQNALAAETFASLGYPTYLTYVLAVAKLLGVIAIVTKRSALLKEWAYAGFFFDFVLAMIAHLVAGDGQFFIPIIAIVLLLVSRFYDSKLF